MQLEYDFTVPVPVPQAWTVLLDIERVAPCLPGATLTSYDGETFAGTVRVKLGPVSLTYQGKGRFVSRDEEAGRVVIEASGRDARGAGTAATTATMTMRPAEGSAGTVVTVLADLSVTGRPAQFGRGMIAEVGGKLVGQFADCLSRRVAEAAPAAVVAAPAAAGAGPATAEAETPTAEAGARPDSSAAPTIHVPSPPSPAPPVDLLRMGSGPLLRRVVPYAIGFVAGALVTWALITWLG